MSDFLVRFKNQEVDAAKLCQENPALARQLFAQVKQERIERARTDVNAFIEYVIKDSRTNKLVVQAPMHRAIHKILDEHDRVVLWCHIEAGKTSSVSIGRVLFEFGQNPNLQITIVMATQQQQASKTLAALYSYLTDSVELHEVFPHLRVVKKNATSLWLAREVISRDPSLQVIGLHGNVLGARIDLLILDDVLNYENTRTIERRKDTIDWYVSTLEGRLVDLVDPKLQKLVRPSRVWVLGTAWKRDDIMHYFASNLLYRSFKFAIIDDNGNPNWPSRFPLEVVIKKRQLLGPIEFQRQMMCNPWDDADARFKREWIEVALKKGEGKTIGDLGLQMVPPGYRVYTGIDTAVTAKDSADLTVFTTIIVHPDETREILDIESGRMYGPEILEKMIECHRRWQSILVVENVGAFDFLIQFTKKRSAVPIIPYTTTRGRASIDFQSEQIAAEIAMGKWIFPCGRSGQGRFVLHREMQALVEALLYYNPAGHAPDHLASLIFARHGACRPLGRVSVTSSAPLVNR